MIIITSYYYNHFTIIDHDCYNHDCYNHEIIITVITSSFHHDSMVTSSGAKWPVPVVRRRHGLHSLSGQFIKDVGSLSSKVVATTGHGKVKLVDSIVTILGYRY